MHHLQLLVHSGFREDCAGLALEGSMAALCLGWTFRSVLASCLFGCSGLLMTGLSFACLCSIFLGQADGWAFAQGI